MSIEKHSRTVIKTVSWRILATITTMLIVFVFTGEITLSLGVGVADVILKMIIYYFHERVWNLISWGKRKHPLSSLPVKGEIKPQDMEKIRNQLKELGYLD